MQREENEMSEKWKEEEWAQDFWYSGKVTRRRVVGWGGGAIGALMLVPAPWREAFAQAKPYKIGAINPLSGAGAAGGKTALVGVQMAVDRINGADDESKPDVGRRKTSKLVDEDQIDAHCSVFLASTRLACTAVLQARKT